MGKDEEDRLGRKEVAQFFPHEKLEVYGMTLRFATLSEEMLCSWPSSWAVHDQLDRATESIVTNLAREEGDLYGAKPRGYFLHESLDVYQRSLQVHEMLGNLWHHDKTRSRYVRRVDELSTSLTINIAEGNGRFAKLDHRKFIEVAEDAGTKLAAYLDLIQAASLIDGASTKGFLRQVMAMLAGLRGHLNVD